MTCPNATAPVNIVNNTNSICDLKCEYSFKYPQTSLNIANRGEYISLKTDVSNSPPVTFNTSKYDVAEMRIYAPSLHTYNGKNTAAELIIIHNNVSSNGNLLVCVPMMTVSNSSNTDSSAIFDSIISEVAKTANSSGAKTTVNIPGFSIDKLIPLKPYYSYTGTLPYSPCNGEYDYVVFSKDNFAFLSLSIMAHKSLTKVITANGYSAQTNTNGVFFNKNGPTLPTVKGDIYIECLPTGSAGEQLVPLAKSGDDLYSQTFNMDYFTTLLKNNLIVQILIGIFLVLIIMKLYGVLINAVSKGDDAMRGGAHSVLKHVRKSK
jgi:carbonic anhydrase